MNIHFVYASLVGVVKGAFLLIFGILHAHVMEDVKEKTRGSCYSDPSFGSGSKAGDV
jgi:hypothetical protein